MISSIIKFVELLILNYGPWAVFWGGIVEQIIAPLPASIIVLTTSIITLKGVNLSIDSLTTLLFNIVIPASLGITMGSLFFYITAYKIGEPFIERSSKYLGFDMEDVAKVENRFKKSDYGNLSIFLARCIPIIPSAGVNIFCGLIKYKFRNYVLITFLGTMVQVFFWGVLGWFSGNIYMLWKRQLSFLDNLATLIIIIILIYLIIRNKKQKKNKNMHRK